MTIHRAEFASAVRGLATLIRGVRTESGRGFDVYTRTTYSGLIAVDATDHAIDPDIDEFHRTCFGELTADEIAISRQWLRSLLYVRVCELIGDAFATSDYAASGYVLSFSPGEYSGRVNVTASHPAHEHGEDCAGSSCGRESRRSEHGEACPECDGIYQEDACTCYEYDAEGVFCELCASELGFCEECGDVSTDVGAVDFITGWGSRRRHTVILCESCADNAALFSCAHCDERVPTREAASSHGMGLVEYSTCSDCGDVCGRCQDDLHYCEDCEESYCSDYSHSDCGDGAYGASGLLHSYSYKPTPVFRNLSETIPAGAHSRTYLGFELEVNASADLLSSCTLSDNDGDLTYCKEDGSVSRGFEIVSHPATLGWWAQNWDTVETMLSALRNSGASAEDNGIHVHVSRKAFSSRSHLARFILMVDRNSDALIDLARRESAQWAQFGMARREVRHRAARRDSTDRHRFSAALMHITSGTGKGAWQNEGTYALARYCAVNLQNAKTVELRIWEGTLDSQELLAALALVSALVEFTRDLCVQECMAGALDLETGGLSDYLERAIASGHGEYAPLLAELLHYGHEGVMA